MDKYEKTENFRRLATARTAAINEILRKLSNLASPNYEFTRGMVDIVFYTINEKVQAARAVFDARLEKDRAE